MIQHDETRERFLAAIAERLEPATIAETHLFPPIRQGGLESGVAVVAVNNRSPTGGEAAAEASPNVAEATSAENRLTVYTAKYRLTLKGPDRGKWEFSLYAEADAPLLTVDKVVRGVQQRSGDAEGAERMTREELMNILATREAPEASH